ncbi:rho GDP-dissociation inhibitor 1-like isoform X1 [Rana temporaria]|uniref:rho GDP-dissociation inhibitor 1-like isoform X1 n=2 Tax=Rana temporaria TaxID=8407 RepID=UPI001AADB67B|nr:rho GDP-dissociation inhibitor 1-like isoform X1 [Rana temporaria]
MFGSKSEMTGIDVCEFGGQLLELMWLSVCYRDKMADKSEIKSVDDSEDEVDLNYKAPEKKSVQELQELDKDDESLMKYKQALLGKLPTAVDPNAPNVQVLSMELICNEAPGPIKMELAGNVGTLKDHTYVLKEASCYRVKITFKVNKEIVSGLKYVQHTFKTGIKVDKETHMVGSYGPRVEAYEFLTPPEDAPKGMIARGTYSIKSFFTDDDKTNHLSWEWKLSIKKEWKD